MPVHRQAVKKDPFELLPPNNNPDAIVVSRSCFICLQLLILYWYFLLLTQQAKDLCKLALTEQRAW